MTKSRIGSQTVFLLLRILFEKEVWLVTQVIDSRRHIEVTGSSVALECLRFFFLRSLVKTHWCSLILWDFWLLLILVSCCINDSDDLSFFLIDTLRFFVILIYNCCGLNRWHILCHSLVRRDRLFVVSRSFRCLSRPVVIIPSYFLTCVKAMGAEASRVFIVTLVFIIVVEYTVRRVPIVLACVEAASATTQTCLILLARVLRTHLLCADRDVKIIFIFVGCLIVWSHTAILASASANRLVFHLLSQHDTT